ncbi:MAG: hypothetical protein ACE1ZD_01900 [Dehalococcoidia bacterium]
MAHIKTAGLEPTRKLLSLGVLTRGRLKQRTNGEDILSTGTIGVDMDSLKDQAAIVGIGETVYSRESGRTELSMAVAQAASSSTSKSRDKSPRPSGCRLFRASGFVKVRS